MQYYLPSNKAKRIFIYTILLCFLVVIFYSQYTSKKYFNNYPEGLSSNVQYLVNSEACKILEIKPFDPEVLPYHKPERYFSCRKLDLLTYITRRRNRATLHINTTLLPLYSENKLFCFYSYITRGTDLNNPDDVYGHSKFTLFNNSVRLTNDFVMVQCLDMKRKSALVYENTHATITIKKHLKKKIQMYSSMENRPFSVLLIGIDSVSRLNFIRNMPKSHKFLQNWVSLKGYNKIGDNTFPNIMAALAGYSEVAAFFECTPEDVGGFDRCPLIWKDFKKSGYVTAYAEDETYIGSFNHGKKGFNKTPTDYYFRPYFLRAEKLQSVVLEDNRYCSGPESTGERILNIAKDFATTFKDSPSFGLFWMNSFSHNSLNQVSKMDGKIKEFFEDLTKRGILDKSIIIFFSDHGVRCGEFRNTAMGWLEERLPFIYIWIPKLFRKQFPDKFSNLQKNTNKLTSPFDLFMTLQEIINLHKTSKGCPNCRSLFTQIPSERSCEDAGIPQHWCTCVNFDYGFDVLDDKLLKNACQYLIEAIHNIIRKRNGSEMCAAYSLKKIHRIGISESYKSEKLILVMIETYPQAFFESTLSCHHPENATMPYFEIMGGISRTDKYEPHSKCAEDAILKKFCYCV